MSHFSERIEKKCLNCGTEVHGRYCHICGQENIEPRETVWHLISHFVYDVTHFDGKFFSTVKYLLLKPGYLSKEYIKGRRASYLNPIKMYVFISAFFFLFFFSIVNPYISQSKRDLAGKEAPIDARFKKLKQALEDTSGNRSVQIQEELRLLSDTILKLSGDTVDIDTSDFVRKPKVSFKYGQNYRSLHEYDSIQKSLPSSERDNWLKHLAVQRSIQIKNEYGDDPGALLSGIIEKFVHYFPQMFFISLPLFALLLQLLYITRRNNFYVEHVIFSIHLYCAMFILMFLVICMTRVEDVPYMGWVNYLEWFLSLYIAWYLYKAIRNFYGQRRGKTILKIFLLLLMDTFMMIFLFVIFLMVSIFSL